METRRSEIENGYEITADEWVLTLARKARGAHQQHAFFILEGIEAGQAKTWFMDFCGNPLLPNIKNAEIRIRDPFTAATIEELEDSSLIYRCKARMMDLKEGEELKGVTWHIDVDDAKRLISNIKRDAEYPPVFNILGETSILTGSSAYASSKERGHNCFTYAKSKIKELNVSTIKLETEPVAYCIENIINITSFTLRKPLRNHRVQNNSTLFWKSFVGLGLFAGVALGVKVYQDYHSSHSC